MPKIAIMQPTFMPWLGYFALMQLVDTFVFLDDVQFSKQSWQSRNFIKSSSGALLVSLKIRKASLQTKILDTKLADDGNKNKILATIENCMTRTDSFELVYGLVKEAFDEAEGKVDQLNIGIIERIVKLSGIKIKMINASKLRGLSNDRVTRLIDICKSFDTDTYISPIGAKVYLEGNSEFQEAGINLQFMEYEHPVYPQLFPPFISNMSAIDALANVGTSKFAKVAKSGVIIN